jgi:hypothetical protein
MDKNISKMQVNFLERKVTSMLVDDGFNMFGNIFGEYIFLSPNP